ncbi:Panacea domain-containing protein [Nocardia asteroides]|uniref:Panacea domain-containing protein n=1 Tax=Nocardia asteroides TaxID=1824 RepID=UPI0034352E53
MVTAPDVAGYILQKQGWVESRKLQKLLFFSQAWRLAWDGRPLFDSRFEAWTDGPVEPEVYRIRRYDVKYGSIDVPGADPDNLSPELKAVIDAVLEFYGDCDTQQLIELSHERPWRVARGDLPDGDRCAAPLSNTEIKRWYTAKAINGNEDMPTRPAVQATVSSEGYDEAVDREIDRWSEALRLLAER